jgi:methyl-accepting chemotaxis protein
MRDIIHLSLRTKLRLLIGMFGLLLVAESVQGLVSARAGHVAALRAAALSSVDESLFAALTATRRARATALAALAAMDPIDPAGVARIAENRRIVDTNYQTALSRFATANLTDLGPAFTRLRAGHDALLANVGVLDRALHLPKAARDPAAFAIIKEFLDAWSAAISATTLAVEQTLQRTDPMIDYLLRIKQAAFDMRDAAGLQLARIDLAVGSQRPWTDAEIAANADDDTRRDAAWTTLADFADRTQTPKDVVQAIADIKENYLPYRSGTLSEAVVTLSAGHAYVVSIRELEKHNSAALEPIIRAADQAMQAMVAHAGHRREISLFDLERHGIILILTITMSLAGVVLADRRVSAPMRRLSQVMHRLAQRDTGVAVDDTHRADEIGAMARAVLVFRDEIARAGELAALAERQEAERLQNDAEATNQIEGLAVTQGEVMETMVQGLQQLCEGNLGFHLPAPLAPDYEKMRQLFNQALANLLVTVKAVLAHAQAIGSGTGELAGAADDLARRTEMQAASLEQAAAAIDEVTATIRQTATASEQAQNLAAGARSEAESSTEVVGQTVAAMAEINGSARAIARIIGLIDDIALQTNLLALNAGIEAANAGETGRGFALVAQEVRNLAQRAAVAAKQIKLLVSQALGHVDAGVSLVDQTGAALDRIRSFLADINEAVTVIAAAAREQAAGIAEVNGTVAQMEQVTQQNAAMVEQSAAAVHALAQETEELNQAMARFKLDAAA